MKVKKEKGIFSSMIKATIFLSLVSLVIIYFACGQISIESFTNLYNHVIKDNELGFTLTLAPLLILINIGVVSIYAYITGIICGKKDSAVTTKKTTKKTTSKKKVK